MVMFDDFLLAKQIWRILINEDTLINICLKAKYFPNTTIQNAKTNSKDNYI